MIEGKLVTEPPQENCNRQRNESRGAGPQLQPP